MAAINQQEDAADIWNSVYEELVAPCVQMIHAGEDEQAYRLYRSYSIRLGEKYRN